MVRFFSCREKPIMSRDRTMTESIESESRSNRSSNGSFGLARIEWYWVDIRWYLETKKALSQVRYRSFLAKLCGDPVVFKMARDYLTIPSTCCDCERSFSRTRRTITNYCNTASCNTIETLQLQKDWLHRGVVQSALVDLEDFLADPGPTIQTDHEEVNQQSHRTPQRTKNVKTMIQLYWGICNRTIN